MYIKLDIFLDFKKSIILLSFFFFFFGGGGGLLVESFETLDSAWSWDLIRAERRGKAPGSSFKATHKRVAFTQTRAEIVLGFIQDSFTWVFLMSLIGFSGR